MLNGDNGNNGNNDKYEMLTIISCLVGVGLLFHQMTMETALAADAVKSWSGERALPMLLEGASCLHFQG